MSEEREELEIYLVPRKPWRFEYYIFIYLIALAVMTYYFVNEMSEIGWDPKVRFLGLPYQMGIALLVGIIWTLSAIILVPIYLYAMSKRIREIKRNIRR
jgi:uncharacterized metal-binding protein